MKASDRLMAAWHKWEAARGRSAYGCVAEGAVLDEASLLYSVAMDIVAATWKRSYPQTTRDRFRVALSMALSDEAGR